MFKQDSPWKKICLKCYLKKKKKEGTYQEREKPETKKEYIYVNRPMYSPPIDPVMLKRLIQLCHPDKWNNSVASQEATKWLLEQKKRLN